MLWQLDDQMAVGHAYAALIEALYALQIEYIRCA